jgi:hypothetical protein
MRAFSFDHCGANAARSDLGAFTIPWIIESPSLTDSETKSNHETVLARVRAKYTLSEAEEDLT